MGSKEVKVEKQLAAKDAYSFLKNLADNLPGKTEGALSPFSIDLQDFKKIKMDLKKDGDQYSLKLKVKYSSPETESGTEDLGSPIKYSTLKKQMKNTFKTLKTSIADGNMPERTIVDTFMEQAGLMVSFTDSGYGDEYYEEFMKLCHEFKHIFDAGNFEPLVGAFNAIDARKALCHDKYD